MAAFGAAGALARFTVDGFVSTRRPSDFPFGTLTVNVTGGFTLGLLVGLGLAGDARFIFGTGLLGGYTTFSTWMFEAQRLGESGEWGLMWLNLAVPMLAGVAATGLGWIVGARVR
jgi:CrcB protein